jgi:hypothetical protein
MARAGRRHPARVEAARLAGLRRSRRARGSGSLAVMWRVRTAVAGAVAMAACASAAAWPAASADPGALTLRATADEVGWIALAAQGPDRAVVDVRELTAGGESPIARLTLAGGAAQRTRLARWRCSPRTRRFVATLRAGAGAAQPQQTATATIQTPSCADRLRLIVVPARVRPGRPVTVRVADTWRFGGVTARICARPDGRHTRCSRLRLPRGLAAARRSIAMSAPGNWTIAVRTTFGQRLAGRVEVRDGARLRVLVTGDSLIFGLFEALAGDLGRRGAVVGDPHPGRGLTTPGFLDWPLHARRTARDDRPDVTVVVLGYADAGYPLAGPSGEIVACCEPPWVAAYASLVRGMMATYLRDGRGLVYWVLLPAPRSPRKAVVTAAQNEGVRLAGGAFVDGVRVIARVADILAPQGRYREAIELDGRTQVVRADDGVHLAAPGIRIATDVVRDTLRGDGLLRAPQ